MLSAADFWATYGWPHHAPIRDKGLALGQNSSAGVS